MSLAGLQSFQSSLDERRFRFRVLEAELLERVGDGASDEEVARVLVVGRHYVPGRPLRAGARDHIAERPRVQLPLVAVVQVALAELPVLRRILESLDQLPF